MKDGRNILIRALRLNVAGLSVFGLLCAASVVADDFAATATNRTQFRLGFSSSTFTDVNENDARAGLKVWAQTLLKERGLPVDPEPVILKDPEAIAQALHSRSIDAITMNTDEYWKMGRELCSSPFIAGLNDGRTAEEYVLLVRQDSKIERLEELGGRKLALYQNLRMCLAPAWLDTILIKADHPRANEFCHVTQFSKLSKVVLPVFFRQIDACVVTRRGFRIMGELNPQVSQQLKIIATSPELVPTGFFFRGDYHDSIKANIMAELAKIKDSPAGAQILTLFQSGSLEAQPLSCLDSAFALLELHQRLCRLTNSATTTIAKALPSEARGGVE